jgi:hypothetical protein
VRSDLLHPGWCTNLVDFARVRPGERVLVCVDEPLAVAGSELAAAVAEIGAEPRLELWTGRRPLTGPPPATLGAAREADVGFLLQQEPLGAEAAARGAVYQAVRGDGGRMVYMGLVDPELLAGELSQPAPDLGPAARALLAQVEQAERLRLRTRAGTDLELRVAGRPWHTDALPLEPGGMGNFPGGEIFVAPHEDGADGVLLVDVTVPYTVHGLLDSPVTIRFEAGRVLSIEGGRAAGMLRELVADGGNGADVIAELGIGLNPAVRPRGHVMLDEKAARTAHVAIGDNTGFGGVNESAIHVDCVFAEPELEADGRRVDLP